MSRDSSRRRQLFFGLCCWGELDITDAFGDLGGVPPAAAYYRLKWQP